MIQSQKPIKYYFLKNKTLLDLIALKTILKRQWYIFILCNSDTHLQLLSTEQLN